jgi:deoxyribonuclease-4
MNNKTLYIGHNINISHGLTTSVDYAEIIGANFFQIFLSSPQTYKLTKHSTKDLITLRDKLKNKNMKMVIHGNFMLNFCNDVKSYKHKNAIKLLVHDLNHSVTLNSMGVIIHMGKKLKMDEEVAISNYVLGVKKALSESHKSSVIILETGAGVGTEVCTMLFKLGKLYERFTVDEQKRIKFCIDTCHIFSAGYDIGDKNYVNLFIKLVTTHLSWDKVACIHLNDSKCSCGSKKDRHADLGEGCVNIDGLKTFIKFCHEKDVPIVLETPCDVLSKKHQIAMVKSWI